MSESSNHRPDIIEYMMGFAHQAAKRATCPRLSVGAVIARDKRVLTTGYNGAIAGTPHCTEVGCLMLDDHCVRTNHAEVNAVLQGAKNGVSLDGAVCFSTVLPCLNCLKTLAGAGVTSTVYESEYRPTDLVAEYVKESRLELVEYHEAVRMEEAMIQRQKNEREFMARMKKVGIPVA